MVSVVRVFNCVRHIARRRLWRQTAIGDRKEADRGVNELHGTALACRPARSSLYVRPLRPPFRALRLAVQHGALSRRKHGFDSRRARNKIKYLVGAAASRSKMGPISSRVIGK